MNNKEKIKVCRTTEGTIFEIALAVMLMVIGVLIAKMYVAAPDVVPTHFGATGEPNGWGSKSYVLIPCLVIAIGSIFLMISAYFPHKMNIPVEVSTPRQWALVVRLVRVMALDMALLTLPIAFSSLSVEHHTALPIMAVTGLMFITVIVFCVLIHKAR
jgi:uncharacterized membrane protein